MPAWDSGLHVDRTAHVSCCDFSVTWLDVFIILLTRAGSIAAKWKFWSINLMVFYLNFTHQLLFEQACHLSHLSVCLSVCPVGELWKNGWLDLDAVWSGVGSRDGCIRWGPRPQGEGGWVFSLQLVCLSVYWWRPKAMQKRLNQSKCRLRGRLTWAQETTEVHIGATWRIWLYDQKRQRRGLSLPLL